MAATAALREKIEDEVKKKGVREIHVFTFPAALQGNGIETIGVVQITSQEEIQATKRSHSDSAQLPYQMAMSALVEVNGDPVSLADGSVEAAWERLSPKQRVLALSAYNEVNVPSEAELVGFIKSQAFKVG